MTKHKRISQEKTEDTGRFSGTWVTKNEMTEARSGAWVYDFDPPIPFTIVHEKEMRTVGYSPTGIITDRAYDKYELQCTLPDGKEFKFRTAKWEEHRLIRLLGDVLTENANTAFRYGKPHMLTGRATRRPYIKE